MNGQTNSKSPQAGSAAWQAWGPVPTWLAALSIAAMIGGPQLVLWLRYDRQAILDGEVWRLLTAHIVHLGWQHLLMNLAGLFLIWLLFGRLLDTPRWALVTLACALGVGVGLLLLHPGIEWYVGMSGLLHGMFVAGALASLAAGYRAELLLLALLAGKLAWEQLVGPLPGSEGLAGGRVVVDAHLYGAVTGLVVIAGLLFRRRARADRGQG